jgi:hypothetical protein
VGFLNEEFVCVRVVVGWPTMTLFLDVDKPPSERLTKYEALARPEVIGSLPSSQVQYSAVQCS